jgi:hypothetical protein
MPVRRGDAHKHAVLSLVDRETRQVRSFHVERTSAKDLLPITKANVGRKARS